MSLQLFAFVEHLCKLFYCKYWFTVCSSDYALFLVIWQYILIKVKLLNIITT